MEDGSGKCLLDVISDPAALNEFLRSNSQISLDGNEKGRGLSSTTRINFSQSANLMHRQSLSQVKTSNHNLTSSVPLNMPTNTPSSTARVSQNAVLHLAHSVSQGNHNMVVSNPGVQNGRANPGHSVMQNVVRTSTVSPSRTLNNHTKSATDVQSNAKAATVTPASFQGKKPIPIQPKNPVLLPAANVSGSSGIQANIMKGLQSLTPPGVAVTQARLPQPAPMTTSPVVINGVDTSSQQMQNLGMNIRTQNSANQVVTTPPKRIAPKQQVMSPPLNSPSKVQSLIQMQSTVSTPQKMQIVSPLVQVQGGVQGTPTNVTQILPQQLVNVVRQQQPAQNAQGNPQIQPVSTLSNPVQHVQQIQQLVQQKLSTQQSPVHAQPATQQKTFTPAQLQAALKQTKLLAQSAGGQQPSLQVQQQILKQLLLLQQRPQEKSQQQQQTLKQAVQQPSAIQQLQKQVQMSTPQAVSQPQTVVNLGNQQVQAVSQLVVANQAVTGNQQVVTQLVTPNQTRIVNRAVPTNQQQTQVTLANNLLTVNQQGVRVVSQVANSKQIPVTLNQQGVIQPILVVSHPQLVTQNAKNVTTSGTQLQTLVDQQQKQLQQILAQTRTLSQPAVSVAGNVQSANQNKLGQSLAGGVLNLNQVVNQVQTVKGQQVIQTSTQPNLLIQPKPATTVVSQPVTHTQQLTVQQLQQLQNTSGVQKVFIIKQPELLQKLGMQGLKPQQTIQITQQQLQALRQMQVQQPATTLKTAAATDATKQSGVQPKLLTTQHLKQLQALQQQQAASGTKVVTPTLLQTQQTLIQKQAIAQQLQKQFQSSKTQPKLGSHLPRILQTSGRQPVASGQASHVKTSIKQEPNRGVKRSHPETPEPPKVVTRLKASLSQDQHAVLNPDVHTPFKSVADANSKLIHYHVYHEPDPTPKEVLAADALYNAVATQLIKRSDRMMEKYRHLVLEESMRDEPSSEMVMLYRVFLADERANLAQERSKASEDLKALEAAALERQQEQSADPPAALCKDSTTATKIITTTKATTTTTTLPLTCTTTTLGEPSEDAIEVQEDRVTSQPALDVTISNSLEDEEEDSDVEDIEESEVDKAVHNMESSTSFFLGLDRDKLSLIDSPRTNTATPPGLECAEEMDLDDDGEKEDVTATLALLHSMAEELDDTIS